MRFLASITVLCLAPLTPAEPIALRPGGLTAKEIAIVYNTNEPASKDVATFYAEKRGVPLDNLIGLPLPTSEDISRPDYDAKLVAPLRQSLQPRRKEIRALLMVYGVPLRVGAPEMNADEKAQWAKSEPEYKAARAARDAAQKAFNAMKTDDTRAEMNRTDAILKPLDDERRKLLKPEAMASVDGELMLLWADAYPLDRWVWNPMHFTIAPERKAKLPLLLMTCRLDGPTPEIAKRLVTDALTAEAKGLTGKLYIDARGIKFDPAKDTGHGYGGYDESMRETAKLFEKAGFPTTLDDRPELFAPQSCPDTALYCGWYSHAKFIDCCIFNPGAVAWHLASSECVSLRRPNATYWCKNLLEKGACVTLGPVAEPYTIGFPKPAEFFGMLAVGDRTLVECYAETLITTSWMTVLLGDPLYRPFAVKPLVKLADVKPSPVGGKAFLP